MAAVPLVKPEVAVLVYMIYMTMYQAMLVILYTIIYTANSIRPELALIAYHYRITLKWCTDSEYILGQWSDTYFSGRYCHDKNIRQNRAYSWGGYGLNCIIAPVFWYMPSPNRTSRYRKWFWLIFLAVYSVYYMLLIYYYKSGIAHSHRQETKQGLESYRKCALHCSKVSFILYIVHV